MTRIATALALVALGAGAMFLVMSRWTVDTSQAVRAVENSRQARAPDPPSAASPEPATDVAFTLSPAPIDRAGIAIGRVTARPAGGRIRIPAVVEPNAYRSVAVTPVVGGRVTNVSAELGRQVQRGVSLAHIYSPELAEAQSRYVAARAELDAHERELRRVEKLVELGSASRQELEKVHAEHTSATTMLQSLRARLTLLGMTASQIEKISSPSDVTATTDVRAPIDGVITNRTANVGLNVDPSTQLFTIVDLSTVWVVGNLYERDFGRVRVGSRASITSTAYPDQKLEGKVSYIDPQVNADTRTARIRIELPNSGRQLRLGMYAEMQLDDTQANGRITIPRSAIQIVGDRSVVYLADMAEAGRFVERVVQPGSAVGEDEIEVAGGLQAGDSIVVKGSFALRAERDRLGLRPPAASDAQPARITVSEKGFEPGRVPVRAGQLVRLVFVRTTDGTCATEVTMPSLKISRPLPLNQPVEIEFMPQQSGEIEFWCGMNMFKGTIVVE